MSSAVKTRANHYELLGLNPGASQQDITRAFTREVGLFRPRPVGALAEVGLAYETLRDPAKRAAYDARIGIVREPRPAPKPQPKPYITNAAFLHAVPRFAGASQSVLPPKVEAEAPAAPVVMPEPQPEPELKPAPIAAMTVVARPPAAPARPSFGLLPDSEGRPVELNRTVAIAGALMLVVAVGGAWAGSQAGQDAASTQPKNVVTAALPKPKAAEPVAEAGFAAVAAPTAARAAPRERALRRAIPAVAAQPVAQQPSRDVAEQNRFARDSIAQALAAEPPAADTPQPIAASMPLSNATVARTIERIGYRCGSVSSTTAGESAGVYNVTCSSGQSFQAKPVRGRYHFRRVGR